MSCSIHSETIVTRPSPTGANAIRCQWRESKPHENHQTASSFGPSVISSKYPTSVLASRFHPAICILSWDHRVTGCRFPDAATVLWDPLPEDVRRHGPIVRGELEAAAGTALLRDEDQMVQLLPIVHAFRIAHFAAPV